MSTLGTLGYYADSHIPHEDDDHFSTAPAIQSQTREPSLSQYGEPDSYPFQSKSAIFGASWSPVPVQPPGGTSIAYHPYIHQPCPTAESDGASARAWALESLSASVPFAGLSTEVHHDIKLEPLVGSGECTTLDARTLMAPDAQNNANPAGKEADLIHADVTDPREEKTLTETKPDLDPSKCSSISPGFQIFFYSLRRYQSAFIYIKGTFNRKYFKIEISPESSSSTVVAQPLVASSL